MPQTPKSEAMHARGSAGLQKPSHALSVPSLSETSSPYRAHNSKPGNEAPRGMLTRVPVDILASASGHTAVQHTVPLLLSVAWKGLEYSVLATLSLVMVGINTGDSRCSSGFYRGEPQEGCMWCFHPKNSVRSFGIILGADRISGLQKTLHQPHPSG